MLNRHLNADTISIRDGLVALRIKESMLTIPPVPYDLCAGVPICEN